MNLIEQLGGYDRASKIANCKSGVVHPTKPLLDALLEYRREHNIFEVGDKVCFKTLGDGYVHKYTKYHEFKYDLKHATPEEIKAGRRI